MYHSVKDSQRVSFSKQLKFIKRYCHAVPADYKGKLQNYRRYISVTFDDAYQNFISNVLHEIKKYGIPTTLFIPTGNLGKKPEWVTDPTYDYINETVMTKVQLNQLPLDLITIGSHTVTHPHLTKVSKEIVKKELSDSKKTLEEIFHNDINLFSLPYGSYNSDILKYAKSVGYERVFLNIPSFPFSGLNTFLIGRIDISPDDWPIEYRLKILGAYQWLSVAIFIKRKLHRFLSVLRK